MKKISEKEKISPAAIAAGAACFALLEILLYRFADKPIAEFTHGLDTTHHGLIDFFRSITDFGKGVWYLVPCGVATIFCAFLSRGKDVPAHFRHLCAYVGVRAFFIFAAVGISGIVADILKVCIGRARPHMWLTQNEYGFDFFTRMGFYWNSMPSGHSTTVFAVACSLAYLYPRQQVLWFAYALLIACSRVMVDAHYVSDICAGAVLGSLTVWGLIRYGKIHSWKVIFPIDMLPFRK